MRTPVQKATVDALVIPGANGRASDTDTIHFVSLSTNASDANDGLSHGTAYATSSQALTKLGSSPGVAQLLGGTHLAPAGGINLVARQALHGLGGTASQISGANVTSGAVVKLAGSRSAFRDAWLTAIPANATALRITGTGSTECVRVDNVFADCNQGHLGIVAFGVGDDVSNDVSEICLSACVSVGNGTDSIHLKIGNGATGNVLDILNLGGNSSNHQYGVEINGGSLVSLGLNFETSKTADIWLNHNALGNVSIRGGRSENAQRFIVSAFGSEGYSTVRIADYTAQALQNTDGQAMQLAAGQPIALENIELKGANAPQYIALAGTSDVSLALATQLDATNIASEHPYPFRSPWARPGKIIRSRGTRFIGNASQQVFAKRGPELWTRRKNVTTSAAFSLDPVFFDAVDVRLSANAGAFTLAPGGAIGQTVTICFEQNGTGGWTYSWPARCAFSGGSAPAGVTTARNRQSCSFRWNGRFWEQAGAVSNIVPPSVSSNPITETFASGNPFWLGAPSGGGTSSWEHIPGGGSLGVNGGKCTTPCLGFFGDDETDGASGFFGPAAGAVIETGMATTATGISATLTWQFGEGIVAHYLDDQTFFVFSLAASALFVRSWTHGALTNYGNFALGSTLVAGSTHTLLVKCTGSGFDVSLDAGAITIGGSATKTIAFAGSDQANLGDLTKHGLMSSSRLATFTAFSVS